jgi:hypothetical protein
MANVFKTFFRNLVDFGLEYFKRYYGFYNGICMDNEDPEEQGRIMIKVPLVTGNETHSNWAEPMMPAGSKDGGILWIPEVDDPVYATFINGDPRHPRYLGGYWPKPEGDNYTPEVYTNGKPTKKTFKTHAGHELTFSDDPEKLNIKMVWRDKEMEKNSLFTFTDEGGVQIVDHKGNLIELRADDDGELVLIVNKDGSSITLDKDGIKLIDAFKNALTMSDGLIQMLGQKDVVINSAGVNVKTGSMAVGDIATDSAIKGTSWLAWWNTVMLVWMKTHAHPTGVGMSGVAVPVATPPPATLLTDILKMQ